MAVLRGEPREGEGDTGLPLARLSRRHQDHLRRPEARRRVQSRAEAADCLRVGRIGVIEHVALPGRPAAAAANSWYRTEAQQARSHADFAETLEPVIDLVA